MRATQVDRQYPTNQIVIARRAASGRPNLATRKWVARIKRAVTILFERVGKAAPAWPEFAGHDTELLIP
jgi:hypothetical protein